MSFMSEYAFEFIEFPVRTRKPYNPDGINNYIKYDGNWLHPKFGSNEREPTEKEIREFIRSATKDLKRSAYTRDYCKHWDPELKSCPFKPKYYEDPCQQTEQRMPSSEEQCPPSATLNIKDTELMKQARELYEKNLEQPTLQPMYTQFRVMGYMSHRDLKTGLSEYQGSIGRVAYEMVRDGKQPKCRLAKGRAQKRRSHGDRPLMNDILPYDE